MPAPTSPTDPWGVVSEYQDALGQTRKVRPATRKFVHAAMGAAGRKSPPEVPVHLVPEGKAAHFGEPGELILESGERLRVEKKSPPDLPSGVHRWEPADGNRSGWLIISPSRCPTPPKKPVWGWAAQLYAVRSGQSWGIGDFADLRKLLGWSRRDLKAEFALLNPLCPPLPLKHQENSPYSPSSRLFLNPLYLRLEDIPASPKIRVAINRLADEARALNEERLINRDAVFRLKMTALEKLWGSFKGDRQFERYRQERGDVLQAYGTFCALAEKHQSGWPGWPQKFRRPENPEVRRFAEEHRERVLFHQWIQWLLDRQLARAARELPLMFDLPVGITPDGFDAWLWQESLARDVAMGAPPDEYNAAGQNWGITPFIPHRLRENGFLPWRLTVRSMLRHAKGLRVDHVMGLFRLFWIPKGGSPAEGAFVRYPADEMLAILAIEAQRAGAVVVGEDLGTVEDGVREAMRARCILSYRLFWFERSSPADYPVSALAAVTTHDLFTIAGLWSGEDLQAQRRLGLKANEEGMNRIRRRIARVTGLPLNAPVEVVIPRLYAALSRAPSKMRTAALDDALAVVERPNMPGTIHEWPNWRLTLPATLEEIRRHPLPRKVAAAMRGNRSKS